MRRELWALPLGQRPIAHLQRKLETIVDTQDSKIILTQLAAYILYPVVQVLHDEDAVGCHEQAMATVKFVIDHSILEKLDQLIIVHVLTALPIAAFDFKERRKQSEEFRLDAANIVKKLIVLEEARNLFVNQKAWPLGAHILSMLLDFVERDSFSALSTESLLAINFLIKEKESDFIATVMPGILSSVSRVAMRSANEHHTVVLVLIDTFEVVITGCLADAACLHLDLYASVGKEPRTLDVPAIHGISRDTKWLKNSVQKIRILSDCIVAFKTHRVLNVRLRLVNVLSNILLTCASTLRNCRLLFIDTILALASDKELSVSFQAQKCLNDILYRSDLFCLDLENILSQKLSEISKKIIRNSDPMILSCLRVINGLLDLLQDRAKVSVDLNCLEICQAFIWLFSPLIRATAIDEFNSAGLDIIANIQTQFPARRFEYINDPDIMIEAAKFCGLLVKFGCEHMLAQRFIDSVKAGEHISQSILFLNLCLASSQNNAQSGYLLNMLNIYLAASKQGIAEDRPSAGTPHKSLPNSLKLSLKDANHDLVATSLLLEGLGIACKHLPLKDVSLFLMDGLYFLLEMLGSTSYAISTSALATLQILADMQVESPDSLGRATLFRKKANESKLSALILLHIDYLIDSVSHELHCIEYSPFAPKVLAAAIRIAGPAIIGPLMTDSIDQVMDCLDNLGTSGFVVGVGNTARQDRDGSVGELMNVLHELLKVMHSTHQPDIPQVCDTSGLSSRIATSSDLPAEFAVASDPMKAFYISEVSLTQEELEPTDLTAEEFFAARTEIAQEESTASVMTYDETEKVSLSLFESLAVKILEKALFFLACDSPRIRMTVIQMFQLGMTVLGQRPDALNPLVHQLWPMLLQRCQDSHHFVVDEALRLLGVLAKQGRSFLRRRVKDDISMPLLSLFKKFQERTVAASVTRPMKTRRENNQIVLSPFLESSSVEEKMLITLFETLKIIVENVPISSAHSDDFSEVMIHFFNAKLYSNVIIDSAKTILIAIAKSRGSSWIDTVIWATLGCVYLPTPAGCLALYVNSAMHKFIQKDVGFEEFESVGRSLGPFTKLTLAARKAQVMTARVM